jgi:hypothetical protein
MHLNAAVVKLVNSVTRFNMMKIISVKIQTSKLIITRKVKTSDTTAIMS